MTVVGANKKRNLTPSLSRDTLTKVKFLATRRSSSISGSLTGQINLLAGVVPSQERFIRQTVAALKKGGHLGGGPLPSREALHEG